MNDKRFSTGETVVLQDVWAGRLWSARPVTVVEDRGDFVALWLPRGAICKVPVTPTTRPRPESRTDRIMDCLQFADWEHQDRAWDASTLWLMEAGAGYALWWSWHANGEPWGWYINVQEVFSRTRRGFRSMDLMLDVVVDLDGSWTLKDEADLQAMLDRGLIDADRERGIRAEAARAIRRLEANERPFSDPWSEWRPDPEWGTPSLPRGWDGL